MNILKNFEENVNDNKENLWNYENEESRAEMANRVRQIFLSNTMNRIQYVILVVSSSRCVSWHQKGWLLTGAWLVAAAQNSLATLLTTICLEY